MRFLGHFWVWLSSAPTPARATGDPDLHPINTQRLANELDLEKEAERLGKRELPPTDSTDLTGLESKLIQVVEKARQGYADWASRRLKILNNEINSIDLTPVTKQALQLDAEFERRANALLHDWTATLKQHSDDTRRYQ